MPGSLSSVLSTTVLTRETRWKLPPGTSRRVEGTRDRDLSAAEGRGASRGARDRDGASVTWDSRERAGPSGRVPRSVQFSTHMWAPPQTLKNSCLFKISRPGVTVFPQRSHVCLRRLRLHRRGSAHEKPRPPPQNLLTGALVRDGRVPCFPASPALSRTPTVAAGSARPGPSVTRGTFPPFQSTTDSPAARHAYYGQS